MVMGIARLCYRAWYMISDEFSLVNYTNVGDEFLLVIFDLWESYCFFHAFSLAIFLHEEIISILKVELPSQVMKVVNLQDQPFHGYYRFY